MQSNRLEAFSDGVMAIIITIMVLELKLPDGGYSFAELWHSTGIGLLTYLLSFAYVGIYWSNHHHLFQVVRGVDGAVLWANLHLLFWLSLVPLTQRWLDQSSVARDPTVVYGINLLGAAAAYFLLQQAIFRTPTGGDLREALGRDLKGKLSPFMYLAGIALAYLVPWAGLIPPVIVALVWLVPDRRVERYLERTAGTEADQ
ncbi:TMEM175 family protein [Gryllotalpicola reticulitermitis]|uniref:TMEM175 family protein n=1 Tax=Gryllotalpicola reticulitermitis TaxID=1184153 RepID=A0ABV8Q3E6_9MICO